MTIELEAKSKENDYSKQGVNYFQSWHMGTTNKLLKTSLQKQMHSSNRQTEAVVTYLHTMGENCLGLNRHCHHYKWFKKCMIT